MPGEMHSCERFREALSARLDREDPGMAEDVIDAHLAGCATSFRSPASPASG